MILEDSGGAEAGWYSTALKNSSENPVEDEEEEARARSLDASTYSTDVGGLSSIIASVSVSKPLSMQCYSIFLCDFGPISHRYHSNSSLQVKLVVSPRTRPHLHRNRSLVQWSEDCTIAQLQDCQHIHHLLEHRPTLFAFQFHHLLHRR